MQWKMTLENVNIKYCKASAVAINIHSGLYLTIMNCTIVAVSFWCVNHNECCHGKKVSQ